MGRWAALLIGLIAGCVRDDGLGRKAISGEVTLDGKPVATGSILFDPESDRIETAVGTLIRGGRFALAKDRGPVPGRYVVRIYASSGVQAPPPAGASEQAARPMVELIPGRYNAHSTLRAEVVAEGANAFRFAMDSDPDPPTPLQRTKP